MQILRGRGKLYTSQGEYLDKVTYEIIIKSVEGTGADWRGQIVPDNGIMPLGVHIIEMEDGRRGTGVIGMNTFSSFELVVDSFSIRWTSPFRIQNG